MDKNGVKIIYSILLQKEKKKKKKHYTKFLSFLVMTCINMIEYKPI